MGRIDDAIRMLEATEDGTERALQLAGLITTLFKLKGVALVVTGQLAYDAYATTGADHPEIEMAPLAGEMTPRTILEIMRGQLFGTGSLDHWRVAGISVRLRHETEIIYRELCQDYTTENGVVLLVPVEEITAEWILAAVYPAPDPDAASRAHTLLHHALADVFHMDWSTLHAICHQPDYRVGEELAQMRLAAKKEVDAMGKSRDHIGETTTLPKIESFTQEETVPE